MPSDYEPTQAILTRRVRRLRMAVGVLLLITILLGSLSAYLLRSLDRGYSSLIDRSLPVLNELRLLTVETLSTQRALLASLAAVDEEGRTRALVTMEAQMELGRLGRESLTGREVFDGEASLLHRLKQAGANYDVLATQFVALMKAGHVNEAQRLRNDKIKDVIKLYLDDIEAAAKYVEGESLRARQLYSGTAQSHSLLLLSLAGLPVVLVFVLAVMIAIFALIAVTAFFRSEPENGASP